MSLISLIAIIACVGLVIWAVPRLPQPWSWIAVAVVLAVALWLLVGLVGDGNLAAVDLD